MKILHDLTRKLSTSVWEPDLRRQPAWSAMALRLLRTMWAVVRDFRTGDINLRAMSLVYTTMLSLVPLLAVSFSVLKGFGVHEELETMMMRSLMPLGEKGVEIGIRIVEFVDNVEVGVLGSVGMALLFYTVLSLMQKIERTFNFIWLVPNVRPFAQRFSGYLSVILIGPILIFAAMGISASLMNSAIVESLTAMEPFGTVLHAIGRLAPFALAVTAFTAIYIFMPNTRVRLGSAAYGAVIAGLLWNVAGWMFATLVVSSAQYTAIYSAFAALVVFMLWLYVAWLVMLLGASVAFYHQHPEHLTLERGEPVLSPRMAEGLALAMAVEIAADYTNRRGQPSTEDLARRLDIPATTADRMVRLLAEEGFIIAADASPAGWLPAMPPETLQVAAIIDAVRASGETASLSPGRLQARHGIGRVISDIDEARAKALAGLSLADIIVSDPEDSGAIPLERKIL